MDPVVSPAGYVNGALFHTAVERDESLPGVTVIANAWPPTISPLMLTLNV
jgi:hypothetical protein